MTTRAILPPHCADLMTGRRSLEGQVALVTGGSRGIGNAIACSLARSGCAVVLVARTHSELREARERLAGTGATVDAIAGDVSDRAFCISAVREVEERLGNVEVLVNCAGIQGPIGLFETLSADEFVYTVAVDFFGAVWMCQAVAPGMKHRHSGVIVNVSGGGAASPRERSTPYAAAKTTLVRFTETAALELAPFHVTINAVAPGAVNTRMLEEVERAGQRRKCARLPVSTGLKGS